MNKRNLLFASYFLFLILLTAALVQSCGGGSKSGTEDGDGNSDPPAGDTIPPTTPSNLTATVASSSRINLSWTASTDNIGIAGYQVWRGPAKIATVTGTTYDDTGLMENTTYTYTVKAFDAADNISPASSPSSATTVPLMLLWDAPTLYEDGTSLPEGDITGFRVYVGTSSNSYSAGSSYLVSAETTSVIVRNFNLTPGTYYFVVTTLVVSGKESGYSNEVSADVH